MTTSMPGDPFFGGLAADFDAAASLNNFHVAAATRFEAPL
jgi:hypothetical protein